MIVSILYSVVNFYVFVIFIYVILSWFPQNGIIGDIYRVLGTVCEPYLSIFRKIIPPIGGKNTGFGIDISPIVAVLALELLLMVVSWIF